MNPLSALAPYRLLIEVLLIGSLIVGVGVGIHEFIDHQQKIGYDRRVAEDKAQEAKDLAAVRLKDMADAKRLADAIQQGVEREKANQALAAAVAAAAGSLHDVTASLNRSMPTASLDAARNYATTAGALLDDCTARYRLMAEKAAGHASDVKTLTDAWPK